MQGIILAAGYATRMGEQCRNFPKPLLEIEEGKPIVNYLVESMAALPELARIHVVTNARFYDLFVSWRDHHPLRAMIEVWNDGTASVEDRLGAIGDLRFLLEHAKVDEDVVLAAGDNFVSFPLRPIYDEFHRLGRPALLTVVRPAERSLLRGWVCVRMDETGRVTWAVEKPGDALPEDIEYGAIALYFYGPGLRGQVEAFMNAGQKVDAPGYLPAWLVGRAPVYAYKAEGAFFDVGTPEALQQVRAMIAHAART